MKWSSSLPFAAPTQPSRWLALPAERRHGRCQSDCDHKQRAKILLLAAEGMANTQIAERPGVSRPTVIAWRNRYAREG